jgi:rubrerythrin
MSYSLPEFLAHAVAMEDEAAERYLELADMMEAHDNTEVAGVFRDMHRFSKLHGDSIRERVGDLELPRLKSWEYRWSSPPEVGDEDGFDYLMVPFHALEYARDNEQRAMHYYREVATQADDPEVTRLAGEFSAEEQEHAKALERWLEQTPRP